MTSQTTDTCVSVAPYFKIHTGKSEAFKAVCVQYIALTQTELDCLYYGFSFSGDIAHCREGFKNADALLHHIQNLDAVKSEMTKHADLIKIEVHGIASELAKLKTPLAGLNPEYFELEYGFRK